MGTRVPLRSSSGHGRRREPFDHLARSQRFDLVPEGLVAQQVADVEELAVGGRIGGASHDRSDALTSDAASTDRRGTGRKED